MAQVKDRCTRGRVCTFSVQERHGRFALQGIRRSTQRQTVASVFCGVGFGPRLAQHPPSKRLCVLPNNLAIQERERLWGIGGNMPASTSLVTIGGVESAEERIAKIAFDEDVNTAAIPLG